MYQIFTGLAQQELLLWKKTNTINLFSACFQQETQKSYTDKSNNISNISFLLTTIDL